MTTRRTAWALLVLLACVPTDAPVDQAGSSDESGGSAGPPTTRVNAETTGEATTGDVVLMCEPMIAEIPEAAFVQTFVDTVCAQKKTCG